VAFKLTAEEKKAYTIFLTQMRETHSTLVDAVKDHNDTLEAVNTFMSDVHDRFTEEFDEKSESWQEGDIGCEVAEMMSAWEIEFDTAEEPSTDNLETFEGLISE